MNTKYKYYYYGNDDDPLHGPEEVDADWIREKIIQKMPDQNVDTVFDYMLTSGGLRLQYGMVKCEEIVN